MGAYRDFLATPGARKLLVAGLFPRLAYSMVSLAIFFRVQEASGSIAVAGLAVGASSIAGALTAGPRGWIVDRYGQTLPIIIMAPAYAVAAFALAAFAHSAMTAVVLSIVVGTAAPPINISIRPLWLDIVGTDGVRTAYSFDAAVMNVIQMLGPVIVTFVALNVFPSAGLILVGVSMFIGGVLLALNTHSRAWVPEPREEGEHGLMRSPAMRLLGLEGIAIGFGFGFITIGIPAAALDAGRGDLTGWLMAAMGLGTIIGSVWAGVRAHGIVPGRGLRASTLLTAVFLIPLPFLEPGWAMFAVLLISQIFMGPAHVFFFETIDLVRPRGTAVSAVATLWMLEGAAAGLANAIGGGVAESVGPAVTMALGCIAVFGSPLILTIGLRGPLRAAAAQPSATAAYSG